jgi:hypothetical protein
LAVKETVDLLASVRQFQFSVYDMLAQLIYSRVIEPCSKSKTVSHVFPTLYDYVPMSEDQVYEGLFFVGESYEKYIELFNHQYSRLFKRNYNTCYFDCTNYYFEIDAAKDDKQKGPAKERRTDPIIGQALLLDADLIPLSMKMYPGNESEKPYIRKLIEEMKQRCKVTGRTVQVADKGLNCARNIYAAVKEAHDGYIFSKSIHGHNLSDVEKQWILLEDDEFFADLVFYNRLLKCFVVIELKTGELTHQDLGQLQMYVNYYDRCEKLPEENPTIGILLCSRKNDTVVRMTLPENDNQILASQYQLYLPTEDQLVKEINDVKYSAENKEQ